MTGPSTKPHQGDCGEFPRPSRFHRGLARFFLCPHAGFGSATASTSLLLSLFLVLRLLVSASRLLPPLHLEPGRAKKLPFSKALRTRLIRAAPTRLQLPHFTNVLLFARPSRTLHIDAQAALGQNLLCEIQWKAVGIIQLESFAPCSTGVPSLHLLNRVSRYETGLPGALKRSSSQYPLADGSTSCFLIWIHSPLCQPPPGNLSKKMTFKPSALPDKRTANEASQYITAVLQVECIGIRML